VILSQYLKEWEEYKDNVDRVLLGGIVENE